MSRRILFIVPAYGSDYELRYLPPWQGNRMAPLGILSIVSYLASKGHPCHLVDCRELVLRHRTHQIEGWLSREVETFQPDLAGIGMISAHFHEVKRIADHLRARHPRLQVIAGGPHPSVEPELTLAQIESLDAVCVGPGEEVALALAEGDGLEGIDGLMVRGREDRFVRRGVTTDIDRYPFPYQSIPNIDFYTGYSAYSVSNWLCRSLVAVSSRGCPFGCRFCSTDWSRPFRAHSVDYFLEMVRFLAGFEIDTINFRDDTFGADRERLRSICEGLERSGLFGPSGRMRWRALLRTDQVSPELLAAMKRAGCVDVGVGMESGTDRILRVLGKRTTVERNIEAYRYIREAGLEMSTNFIVGVPTETEEEILSTIEFMDGLEINGKGLSSFRPVPGSSFYRDFVASGLLSREASDWTQLGDWSLPPDRSFCEVGLERLRELTALGQSRSFGRQRIQIEERVARSRPDLVDEVARRIGARIVPVPGGPGEARIVDRRRAGPSEGRASRVRALARKGLRDLAKLLPAALQERLRARFGGGRDSS